MAESFTADWLTRKHLNLGAQNPHCVRCERTLRVSLKSMYLELPPPVEASCQQSSGLDGDRRQLPLPLQDVSDGVDVRNVGLLLVAHRDLSCPEGSWEEKGSESSGTLHTSHCEQFFFNSFSRL